MISMLFLIGSVMVSMLSLDAVDDIYCFSAKHASLMRKRKDWFGRNQDNESERHDMSISGLLLQ